LYAVVFHTHQKLDRAAYKFVKSALKPNDFFPTIKQILNFEGGHGPDSAKLKRHKPDAQPWHFVNPFDENDTDLDDQIKYHYKNLVRELRAKDSVRSAFEAAWLAHAVVDGLTPSHHFPYEAEIEKLRGGETKDSRKGLVGRLYVKSDSMIETVHKSLMLIGPKGVLTSHAIFEAGAYVIIAPLRLNTLAGSGDSLNKLNADQLVKKFRKAAQDIAKLDIYDRFCKSGWIQPVIKDIKDELAPIMATLVAEAWYSAIKAAAK